MYKRQVERPLSKEASARRLPTSFAMRSAVGSSSATELTKIIGLFMEMGCCSVGEPPAFSKLALVCRDTNKSQFSENSPRRLICEESSCWSLYPPIVIEPVPVSYTHLDVYKRQLHNLCRSFPNISHFVETL